MKKHLHQKSFPMGQTRCSWLYSFRNDSLNCDRDKSREITTTEPPHLYILLFVASQLLNILLDFCGVSTIRFLSLSSSFCLKKLKIHRKKVELWGEEKTFGFFLSRSVVAVFHLTNLVHDRHFILLVHFGIFFCSNSNTRIIIRCLQADIHSWL